MSDASRSAGDLLLALSSEVGQAINLDAEGECCLEFADAVEISICIPSDSEFLTIRSPLASATDAANVAMLRSALELNYAQLPPGHEIALDRVSGQLVLMVVLNPIDTERDEFLSILKGFLDLVPDLRLDLLKG